jgi:hypothetical protein
MKRWRSYLYPLGLLFIAVITHWQWFNFFSILNNSDWRYWTDEAVKQMFNSYGAWVSFSAFGSANIQLTFNLFTSIWSLLANSGFSYDFAVKLTVLIPTAVLGFVSPYILVKRFTKSESIAFASALFYGTASYFLVRQTAHLPVAFVGALAPLLLFLLIKASEENRRTNWAIFALTYFISVCYEIRITFILTLILVAYFLVFHVKGMRRLWKNVLLCSLFLLVLNQFWILPTLFGGLSAQVNEVVSRGLFGDFLFDLTHALSLSDSSWTGGALNTDFIKQPVLWYLWLIPFIVFAGLLHKRGARGKKKILFFASLALFGIFLTKQGDVPFPNAYVWLYAHFPGFSLFREASKFFLVTALGYLGMIAYGLLALKEWARGRFNKLFFRGAFAAILFVSACNVWPLITGAIGTMFVPRKMPEEYSVFAKLLKSDAGYFRTLWLPAYPQWAFFDVNRPKVSGADAFDGIWKSLGAEDRAEAETLQDRLISSVGLKSIKRIIDASSIKYIVVPLQDKKNDDDVFRYYGGDKDSGLRERYISELDKLGWLNKLDVGAKELAVYENKGYLPPIFVFNRLNALDSSFGISDKLEAASGIYSDDHPMFVLGERSVDEAPLVAVSSIFEGVNPDTPLDTGVVLSRSVIGVRTDAYFNARGLDLTVSARTGTVTVGEKIAGQFSINGRAAFGSGDTSSVVLGSVEIPRGQSAFVDDGGRLVPIKDSGFSLGTVGGRKQVNIVSVGGNEIPDGSFESGAWQSEVVDCDNYDDRAVIGVSLNVNEKNDGRQSLQLEATRHTACTYVDIPISKAGEYVFSFDYQSPNAKKAQYFLSFDDPSHTATSREIPINGIGWQKLVDRINVPKGAKAVRFYLYAFPKNGSIKVINRYDDVRFSRVMKEAAIDIPQEGGFEKIPIELAAGNNVFGYKIGASSLYNALANGSFEDGLWSSSVGDCHAYDNQPVLAMVTDNDEKTEGRQSLRLEALKHAACTSQTVRVKGGATYQLSIDYQSPNAASAAYYVSFDDSANTVVTEHLPIVDASWQRLYRIIKAPKDATALSLLLYAEEKDGKTMVVNRYDDVKIIEVPDLENSYFLLSRPTNDLEKPKTVSFDLVNPTKKSIHVKGATTAFFVGMSEGYDVNWRLWLDDGKGGGWWPFAKPHMISAEHHYKLDGFLNAWYVDTKAWCADGQNPACSRNDDGSWNIELVAEFWPQRWFYLGLLVSGAALVGCLGYLGYGGGLSIRRRIKVQRKYVGKAED